MIFIVFYGWTRNIKKIFLKAEKNNLCVIFDVVYRCINATPLYPLRAQLLLDKAVHMTYNINDIKVSHDFIQSLYY